MSDPQGHLSIPLFTSCTGCERKPYQTNKHPSAWQLEAGFFLQPAAVHVMLPQITPCVQSVCYWTSSNFGLLCQESKHRSQILLQGVHKAVLRKPAAALYFLEILRIKDDVFIWRRGASGIQQSQSCLLSVSPVACSRAGSLAAARWPLSSLHLPDKPERSVPVPDLLIQLLQQLWSTPETIHSASELKIHLSSHTLSVLTSNSVQLANTKLQQLNTCKVASLQLLAAAHLTSTQPGLRLRSR